MNDQEFAEKYDESLQELARMSREHGVNTYSDYARLPVDHPLRKFESMIQASLGLSLCESGLIPYVCRNSKIFCGYNQPLSEVKLVDVIARLNTLEFRMMRAYDEGRWWDDTESLCNASADLLPPQWTSVEREKPPIGKVVLTWCGVSIEEVEVDRDVHALAAEMMTHWMLVPWT